MIAKGVRKEINKKYEVKKDGKNSLYVSLDGQPYCFSEFFKIPATNEVRIRIQSGGLNLVFISQKLKRRFTGFLGKDYSIYATASYIYRKK